jgi:hypothetical protein
MTPPELPTEFKRPLLYLSLFGDLPHEGTHHGLEGNKRKKKLACFPLKLG